MANDNTAALRMGRKAVERLSTLVELAQRRSRPDLVSLCARQIGVLERTVLGRLQDTAVNDLGHIAHLLAPAAGECSHRGAAGHCLPRVRDGHCIWCDRAMSVAEQQRAHDIERARAQ